MSVRNDKMDDNNVQNSLCITSMKQELSGPTEAHGPFILFQNKIPGLVSLVSVYWGLSSAYLVTFDNDDKSHQNKSHHEITVQLCGIIFRAKVKYTGSILPGVRLIGLLFQIFFAFIYY